MVGAIMYFCLWLPLNICRKLWWRWTIIGTENLPPHTQGFVLASNHISWTDIHMLGASLPLSHRPWWLGKIELFDNRLAAWWLKQMRVIAVRRGKRDLSALEACEKVLRDGGPLVIFPEGHRSSTGGLQEAKAGVVRMAARTNCPIVPVAMYGTEHGFRGAISRKQITVVFGKPYHPDVENPKHIPSATMQLLTEEVMLRIAELMPEQYWGFYKERVLQLAETKEVEVRSQESGVRNQESEVSM
jgi:1-acyl-sn-glycerol-3-phosphate acyltransferase